jgi:hypothetical protein
MAREFFDGVLEATRDVFRHLANASLETMILVAAAIALVAYFLLRR